MREWLASVVRQLAHRIQGPRVYPPGESMPSTPPAPRPIVAQAKALEHERLTRIADGIGNDWASSQYYDDAEGWMEFCWEQYIWPMISDCDFSVVLDLAAGHGRNAARLADQAGELYIVDIRQENITFCRERFAGDPRFHFLQCDGISLAGITDDSITILYCFDAMVHFDSDVVRSYLVEIHRVLKPGGRGFCHHSNNTKLPIGNFRDSAHWRNFMSKELFEHWCGKSGLSVGRSRVIDWGEGENRAENLDCLTVFQKPAPGAEDSIKQTEPVVGPFAITASD